MSSRVQLIMSGRDVREKAIKWINQAPAGTRVEFKAPQRTIPQNDRMWSMLTEVAAQKDHAGRKYSADIWKVLFLSALGREMQFVPGLNGEGFVPLGLSSSDLSKTEMSDLLEFIASWGAQNGVVFHAPAEIGSMA